MIFDLGLFEVYTRGFLQGAQGSLTKEELEHLPWGARLMTLECGIRFLTDYLEGDRYFHISRPEHNLDRCRTQFKLVRDMELPSEPKRERTMPLGIGAWRNRIHIRVLRPAPGILMRTGKALCRR